MEERAEITRRRDSGTPASWLGEKRVLILGCGALGSWVAEIVARAQAGEIHLVDNSIVKPGILVRQNFELSDIGRNKAEALARRLNAIANGCTIVPHIREAYRFLLEDKEHLSQYDLILDCTASSIFQMKLERDWRLLGRNTPPFISLIIDAEARHCLCVTLSNDLSAGIWNSYLWLKWQLCTENRRAGLITAFYSARAAEKMFQPEPGCSDPTFIASTADIMSLASSVLNIALRNMQLGKLGTGIALSLPDMGDDRKVLDVFETPQFNDREAGNYQVRISANVFAKAKGLVDENKKLRSPSDETGGLLWGVWDDALQVIWILDLSGPPPDSLHSSRHFLCGIEGTLEEHQRRTETTHGACGFVGYWHTHPNFASTQSPTDIANMARLVSTIGQNQRRSVMLIFGRTRRKSTAALYVYESQSRIGDKDLISVGISRFIPERTVM